MRLLCCSVGGPLARQTTSNSAIIELDSLGRVAVQAASGGADVIIDVAGWYSDPPAVNYTYNPNGAQTTKTTTGAGAATITYVWDPQGRLCNTIKAPATNPGCTTTPAGTATTRNTYNADSQRLIRRDTSTAGVVTRTLYLDGQELTSTAGATAAATRYYNAGTATIAVRNNNQAVTWLFGDHQGTASITIKTDATNQITRQRYTPYGAQRGTTTNKLETTSDEASSAKPKTTTPHSPTATTATTTPT